MAWSIKRLVSSFNRIITRPHRPRSEIIRNIMMESGIPVPAATGPDDDDDCANDDTDYDELGWEDGEEEDAVEDAAVDPEAVSCGPPQPLAAQATLEPEADVLDMACKESEALLEAVTGPSAPEPLPLKDVGLESAEKAPAPTAPVPAPALVSLHGKREIEAHPKEERPLKRLKNLLAAKSAELKALKRKMSEGRWAQILHFKVATL